MADSNIEIKALGEANMPDNTSKLITPAKMREVFGSMLNHLGGNLYYTSAIGAMTVPSGVETKLLGEFNTTAYKVTQYRPYYVDPDFLIGADSSVKLRDLRPASFVSFRFEVTLTVPSNTEVILLARAKNSLGQQVFDINVEDLYFKNGTTRTKTSNFFFFMDSDVENGTLEIYAQSDNEIQANWKSFLIDAR